MVSVAVLQDLFSCHSGSSDTVHAVRAVNVVAVRHVPVRVVYLLKMLT